MLIRTILFVVLLCGPGLSWGLGWFGNDLYGEPCHGGAQGYGPFDYNDPKLQQRAPGSPLWLVERAHFTPHVQLLMKGANPWNHSSNEKNLDYVLRAFPNHHKALWAMIRWYLDKGRPREALSKIPPAECYLKRAIHFRPKDPVVYMLFGIYLHLAGMPDKAATYYKKSLRLDPDSAEAHYNYGLLLVDEKKYKQALTQARRAYELGYPLPGLRTRLKQAGYILGENIPAKESKKPADE